MFKKGKIIKTYHLGRVEKLKVISPPNKDNEMYGLKILDLTDYGLKIENVEDQIGQKVARYEWQLIRDIKDYREKYGGRDIFKENKGQISMLDY